MLDENCDLVFIQHNMMFSKNLTSYAYSKTIINWLQRSVREYAE